MTKELQSGWNLRHSILTALIIVFVLMVAIAAPAHLHPHLRDQPAHEHCGLCLQLGHLVAICVVLAGILVLRERREFVRVWEWPAELQGIIWLPFVRPPPAV